MHTRIAHAWPGHRLAIMNKFALQSGTSVAGASQPPGVPTLPRYLHVCLYPRRSSHGTVPENRLHRNKDASQ
jgi:hypothetical protein